MRGALDIAAFFALRRLMRREGVRLVHTHSSVDSWLATAAAKHSGLPVVRSRHVSIPVRRHRSLVYHWADRIITSGEEIRRILISVGVAPEKIVAVPAGVETERFHPAVSGEGVRKEFGLDGPVVGMVAMFRRSKGHRVFLEVAQAIHALRPDTRFLVVGDGAGRAEIEGQIQALGLGQAVTLTGFRRDVPELLAAVDCLVLPALRSEGTPQVIPQALAVGTPVVASAVGGIPEIIEDGRTGRLVSPGDAGALAKVILAALDDPGSARGMALRGRELVLTRFNFAQQIERTEAVYRSLL
jgi:glycosyltransferase involved in cell wall biosynthesis